MLRILILSTLLLTLVQGLRIKESRRYLLTNSIDDFEDEEKTEINPDIHLTTPELIEKYGYVCETHTVVTEDGYILNLHRIPHGKNGNSKGKKQGVVLVQHGLTSSSSDWIMTSSEKALPYKLAEYNYDVWLGNSRGNSYSKNHTTYNVKSYKYWSFSWHEMGIYDIPAVIDYILNKTGEESLSYIRHSMGTTQFFVLMSSKPEYQKKVKFMAAMGPAAYFKNIKSVGKYLVPFLHIEEFLLNLIGHGELLPDLLTKLLMHLDPEICTIDMENLNVCENLMFLVSGFDSLQVNFTQLPVILGHTPDSTSTRSLIHYLQLMKTGVFSAFDYGKHKNRIIYGYDSPPNYKLENIKVPIALMWGENDLLCVPEDVAILAKQLPNVIVNFKVDFKYFNHIDFLFAKDADKLVYNPLLRLMNQF